MKMISHQAEGLHLPTGFEASLTQCGEKLLAVLSVAEDGLAPISAIQDVVNGSRIFHSNEVFAPCHRVCIFTA
jgi:hypothetical protein